jgi:alkylated DNA repair dioxygenase AlkB
MRYHTDPDQGELWGYETAVVSVGAARRFAFRPIPGLQSKGKVHNFVVMDGDVTEMKADCQQKFQHTVKTAEGRGEAASRSSLVYKKTFDR